MSNENRPPQARGLGFVVLTLRSLGLGFFCVPFVGLGFGAVGLGLGLFALLRGQLRGFAYSGTVMSVLAVMLNLTLLTVWPEKFRGWPNTQPAGQADL